MPRPINYPISPDAPDSENPGLSAKPKVGPPRMKAPKPKAKGITKPDPQDAGVFTQEKLKRFGGTMRDIPQGMDGAMKKGGKVKRFSAGGSDEYGPGETPGDSGFTEGSANASDDSYTPAPKAEPKTRGEAFRAARAAGDKTFEFEGKKYTTELAKPKAAPAKRPGIMQRMRDKDTAMVKSAQAKTRQGNADLGVGNAAAEKRVTENPMSPAYGQGRTNPNTGLAMKKGGKVSKFAAGGFVRAADGCAQRGKTKGMMR